MTVGELIEKLSEVPDFYEVILYEGGIAIVEVSDEDETVFID